MATAMKIYLRQIALQRIIPFEMKLPDVSKPISYGSLTDEEFNVLMVGLQNRMRMDYAQLFRSLKRDFKENRVMNEWQIIPTPELNKSSEVFMRISQTYCLVPDTAKKQLGRILNRIKQPNEMLSWSSLVENEPWHSRGVRKLIVDNYIVFYYPNEQTQEVIIF